MSAENTVFDLVNSKAIAAYYEKIASNDKPLLGEVLFPSRKKLGLKLDWIRGYDNLPVLLQPSTFDAKPFLRARQGISEESTRMPFFREAARIGEEERQQLLMFLEQNQNPYALQAISKIFDDVSGLIVSANLNPEVMRMKLMTDGAFTIASEGDSGADVSYTYNYDPNGEWAGKNVTQLAGTDAWSDHANSNPVSDLLAVKRKAAGRGISLARMIIGQSTYEHLLANEKVRSAMYPMYSTPMNTMPSDDEIISFIERKIGMTITVYSKVYKDLNKRDQFFYPDDGYATIFPAGNVGYTYYGTTPEEADSIARIPGVDCSIVHTGVAVSVKREVLVSNIVPWVSEIVLPSFENMHRVFNIKF